LYTRVESRFWQDEKMRAVSDDARYLMLYLLTSPHRNILGFYFLPAPYACFDLGWDEKRFLKGLQELLQTGRVKYDERAHVVLVMNYIKYNPFENPNQVKSALGKLDTIPQTPLFKDFLSIVEQLDKPFIQPLTERLRERLGEPGTVTGTGTETDIKDPPPPAPVGDDKQHDEDCDEGHDEGAKPGSEPGSKSGSAEYSEDFLAFWDAYPRKREKRGAFRVWKARLREQVKPAALIAAAKNYAAAMKGKDAKFIKLPTTFLGPDKPYEEWVEGIPDEYKSKTKEAEKTTDYYEDVYLT
jgi:hypothetical protein